MNITTDQLKEIRTDLDKLKPAKVTLDGNRSLTVKEAIRTLAPTLERMRKRGFDTRLHEKGIEVKPPTLAKYLNEFRRVKDKQKDTPPPPVEAVSGQPESRSTSVTGQGFAAMPDPEDQ